METSFSHGNQNELDTSIISQVNNTVGPSPSGDKRDIAGLLNVG